MILNVADDAPVADAVFPVTRLLDQLLFRFIKLQDAVGERLVPATRIPWVLACRRWGRGALAAICARNSRRGRRSHSGSQFMRQLWLNWLHNNHNNHLFIRRHTRLVTSVDFMLEFLDGVKHVRKFWYLTKNHSEHCLIVSLECMYHLRCRRDGKCAGSDAPGVGPGCKTGRPV